MVHRRRRRHIRLGFFWSITGKFLDALSLCNGGRTVEVQDTAYCVALVSVKAALIQFRIAHRGSEHQSQMATRRPARNGNAGGIDAEASRLLPDEAQRGLAVVKILRPRYLRARFFLIVLLVSRFARVRLHAGLCGG